MLISPRKVLERVAERMTDYEDGYEFELNSAEVVLAAFNNALAMISRLVPATFLTPMRVQLGAGEIIQVPECEQIVQIPSVYVNKEFVSAPDNIAVMNQKLRSISEKCRPLTGGKYKAQYVGIAGNNTVRVYPPVPDNVNVEVDLLCACVPQATSDSDMLEIPTNIVPVVEELMLYYLYDIDSEAVPNRGRSSLHYQIATTLLGVSRNAPTATE